MPASRDCRARVHPLGRCASLVARFDRRTVGGATGAFSTAPAPPAPSRGAFTQPSSRKLSSTQLVHQLLATSDSQARLISAAMGADLACIGFFFVFLWGGVFLPGRPQRNASCARPQASPPRRRAHLVVEFTVSLLAGVSVGPPGKRRLRHRRERQRSVPRTAQLASTTGRR